MQFHSGRITSGWKSSTSSYCVNGQAELRERLQEIVDEGVFATGIQASVVTIGSDCIDLAVGDTSFGEPMESWMLHDIFCGLKPLIGLGFGHLVDAGLVDFDVPLRTPLAESSRPQRGATVTWLEALAHRAGLDQVDAVTWRITRPSDRLALLAKAQPAPRPAFSDVLLGACFRSLCLRCEVGPPERWIEETVLVPLGLADEVVVDPARVSAVQNRVRTLIGGLPDRRVPLLSSLLPLQAADVGLAFGGHATMRGLAQLYGAVLRGRLGHQVSGIPSPATLERLLAPIDATYYQRNFDRDMSFSGAFMMRLDQQQLAAGFTAGSFGHTAGIANAVGFAEPSVGLAGALLLNGADGDRDSLRISRSAALQAMLAVTKPFDT